MSILETTTRLLLVRRVQTTRYTLDGQDTRDSIETVRYHGHLDERTFTTLDGVEYTLSETCPEGYEPIAEAPAVFLSTESCGELLVAGQVHLIEGPRDDSELNQRF
jgi:hypothetical protein